MVGTEPLDQEEGSKPPLDIENGVAKARVSEKAPDVAKNHPPRRSYGRSIGIVAVCTFGMITTISSLTSISISLPTIGRDLRIGQNDLQWLMSGYALSNGCFLILFGRLADLYGRKNAFMCGFAWMAAFSIGCGFANDLISLAVLRAFQGMGAAAIIPASVGILAHSFPPSAARSKAFSTFSAGAPIGGALGYNIGGVMTELTKIRWRANFFFIAGMCALNFGIGLIVIDHDVIDPEADRRVDWLGAFLVTSGLALMLFVLGDGTIAIKGWGTSYIIALLIVSVLFLVSFIAWEKYLTEKTTYPPLMPLNIWTRAKGRFAVMQLVAFFEWSGFITWGFWATIYYQTYLHLSPILTMIRFLPMTFTGITCNVAIALLVGRVPAYWLIPFGCFMTSIAGLLFANINTHASYWAFGFPAAIASVFGADFVFAAGSLYVAKVAHPGEQSLAGALFQTMSQLGSAFGLTISTTVHNTVLEKASDRLGVTISPDGHDAPPPAQLKALRAAQWSAFAFPILAAVLGVIFLRGVGIVGHRTKQKSSTNHDELR